MVWNANRDWATEKELDCARNVAERGLDMLVKISRLAFNAKLNESPSQLDAASSQVEYAEQIVEGLIPGLNELAEFATWSFCIDKTLKTEIRTIERAWKGEDISPFANHDINSAIYWATAHQAVIDWIPLFIDRIRPYNKDNVRIPLPRHELVSELCDACCDFQLLDGYKKILSHRIVLEWRTACDWAQEKSKLIAEDKEVLVMPELRLNESEKDIIQALYELSDCGETPATNEIIAKQVGGEISSQKAKEYTGALWRHGLLDKGDNGIGYSLNEVATRALPKEGPT